MLRQQFPRFPWVYSTAWPLLHRPLNSSSDAGANKPAGEEIEDQLTELAGIPG